MKIFKLSALFAMLAFVALSFTACEEDSTTEPVITVRPAAPTSLKAVSLDSVSVGLSWTASASADSAWFSGYELNVSGGTTPMQPVTIAKTATSYTVSGLVEGTEYTFTLKSKNTSGEYSTTNAEVKWAPATRFVANGNGAAIKIYETLSDFGSGLALFTDNGYPMSYKVANSANWDLGLITKSGVLFGSATVLDYNYATTPGLTEITDAVVVNSLNEDFNTTSLESKTFSAKTINLASYTKSIVVYAKKITGNDKNYARILIKAANNTLLQGTGSDRYIEMEISYQKVKNVPYAK